MLVLTRRPGEAVRIGDDIEVAVVEVRGEQVRLAVRGEQVRLAVRAPRHVPVERVAAAGEGEAGEP